VGSLWINRRIHDVLAVQVHNHRAVLWGAILAPVDGDPNRRHRRVVKVYRTDLNARVVTIITKPRVDRWIDPGVAALGTRPLARRARNSSAIACCSSGDISLA